MPTTKDALTETRHREIAVEHLLFWTMRYVERQHPGLLESLRASLDHLGDHAPSDEKDDEAVRAIARRMIDGAA